ncbi:hypothetical protein WME75_23770 [Sorangium sp. So ce1014]|uniref:hypothetical protein n=1 Tax=Sorangium sp. So ce1014 TaxID=3133326 RepID=UPI003F62528C
MATDRTTSFREDPPEPSPPQEPRPVATDRRTRFREYMRRLDPTGDPAQAVASGFYVRPPNAVSRRIATRIELLPASSHLLVGGIGSGKTTEMIVIERELAEIDVDNLLPVRVDVPSRHRIDKLEPGVLVAIAAAEACTELSLEREQGLTVEAQVVEQAHQISMIIKGYWTDDPHEDHNPYIDTWIKGILEAPQPSEDVKTVTEALRVVHGALRRKLVILFDGLDRVTDVARVASVLAEDVPAMGRAGIGLVVVGHQHLRFGPQRFVEQQFETVHLHGAASVDTPEGETFLKEVLRTRVGGDVLPLESADALTRWSGGLMRDLVALGRAACAEAYADGSDTIRPDHINIAADRFGRDLLLGCTSEMASRLRELLPRKSLISKVAPRSGGLPAFTVATDLDQKLLLERLIIEIPGTPIRYILHPTIVPLIPGLGST